MNAPRWLHRRSQTSNLRDHLKSCLFLGMFVINLAGILAIALHTRDPQRFALGATALALLLATLP